MSRRAGLAAAMGPRGDPQEPWSAQMAAGSPWRVVEAAVTQLGGRLTVIDQTPDRGLVAPGLPVQVVVSLGLDLATALCRVELGAGPRVDEDWVVPLAAAQARLRLARYALAGGRLTLVARQDLAAGPAALAAGLRLLMADAVVGWGLFRRLARRGGVVRRDRAWPDPDPLSVEVVASRRELVEADLGGSAAEGWLVTGQAGAWRLVRSPGAPADWPVACQVTVDGHLLCAASAIALELPAGSVPAAALGRFLLAQNGRQPARLRLGPDGESGAVAWVEWAQPLATLARGDLARGLEAVCVAFDAVRGELEVLCKPDIAELLDQVCLWTAERPPPASGHTKKG